MKIKKHVNEKYWDIDNNRICYDSKCKIVLIRLLNIVNCHSIDNAWTGQTPMQASDSLHYPTKVDFPFTTYKA